MAKIYCTKCGAEFDNEVETKCPECGAEIAEEAISEEVITEEAITEEAISDDAVANADTVEDSDIESVLNGDGEDAPAKNNPLKIVAIVLAICVVVAAAWLIYSKVSGPKYDCLKPVTISNVEDFASKDVEGKFIDDVSGTYFEFKIEASEKEVAVPVEKEDSAEDTAEDPTADSAASSSAEPEVEYKTEKFDGTYSSGIDEEYLPETVAGIYVSYNDKTEEYDKYKADNKLTKDDYLGFVKAKGLEDEMKAYDESNKITELYKERKVTGYWRYADGKIETFDENGNPDMVFVPTAAGLTIEGAYYKGEPAKGEKVTGSFSSDVDEGVTQTIRIYEDGYFILETNSGEGEPQYVCGTHKTTSEGVVINLNGRDNTLYVTKDGLVTCLFNK